MKKLLIVMNDFVSGGCETQIFNLYRDLKSYDNYEFTFLYLGKLNQDYYSLIKTEFEELQLIHFDSFLIAKSSLDFYLAYFKLYRLLKRGKFDVIIPFHRNTSVIFGVVNFFLRKKSFFQERGGNLNLVSKISGLFLYLLKRSNLIFVANNFSSGEILAKKLNINLNRVHVIYNGITSEKKKTTDKFALDKLNLNENTQILTFVANFYPEKEHEFLINSIYEYGNLLTSNILLLLVGNDNGSGRLNSVKNLVQKYKLTDKIMFVENLYDVQSVYEITDLALFCSKSEGLANVLIEYLKFELPIVASRIPVFEEVLGKNYPYFYDLNDGKGLIIKIEEILKKKDRKEDAKIFSQTQMHKFDLTKMINSYKQLIDEGEEKYNFFLRHMKDKLRFLHSVKYYSKNFEKFKEYYLKPDFHKNRKHGLSAMMRIKNDEDWIFYAITSIIDYVDEIVIVLQNCTDNTEKIIREIKSEKIKIYYFPFDSFPSGKYHERFLKNSIFNRAYYYNYALALTSYSYVWKWDGDHAAYESRVKELREIIDSKKIDIIHYQGYDVFGLELKYLCKDPLCSNEPAIFRVNRKTFYFSSFVCEKFSYPINIRFRKIKIFNYSKPLFIHFKYAKGEESIGKGWPNNWQKDEYFKSIANRKSKGELFTDEYPEVVKKFYFKNPE